MLSLLIYPEPVEILGGTTSLIINAPITGAKLVSAYITSELSSSLQIDSTQIIGNVYTFTFDQLAPSGNYLVTVFEDPNTVESFEANKSFTVITKGFIPSCDCGCDGNIPIKPGEFIGLKVSTDVVESGVIKALVKKAHRDSTDPSTWVYELAIKDTSINVTKSMVVDFTCCLY